MSGHTIEEQSVEVPDKGQRKSVKSEISVLRGGASVHEPRATGERFQEKCCHGGSAERRGYAGPP